MLQAMNQLLNAYERRTISRRQLLAGLAATAIGVRTAAADERKNPADPTFPAQALNHIALRVTDVPSSRDFYIKHLGLSVWSDGGEQNCFLRCGPDFVALFRGDKPGMDHYCYTVPDYTAAGSVETLQKAGLKPRREGNRVYFDDPDGLTVQVSAPNAFE